MRLHISFGFMVKMGNSCYLHRRIVLYGVFLSFETPGHTKCPKVDIQRKIYVISCSPEFAQGPSHGKLQLCRSLLHR
jgi:hypothetical protein